MWSLDTAPLTSLEKMYKYTFSFDTRTDVKLKNWHTVRYISSVVYYIYICILCIRICIYECKLITMFYVRKFLTWQSHFLFLSFFFSFTRRLSTCTRLLRKIMVRVCNLIAFSLFTNFLHIRKNFSFLLSIILRNLPTWNDFMLKKKLKIYNNRKIINSN